MANIKILEQLFEVTVKSITKNQDEWKNFLKATARLYKYSYPDQVLIYAQRPEATACAEYDVWKNRMGRYVLKGAKGIGLYERTDRGLKIHYVFDISDTGEKAGSRRPWTWKLNREYMDSVKDSLQERYNTTTGNFVQLIEKIIHEKANEFWNENKRDLLEYIEGSFLEELDEDNIEVRFKAAFETSCKYVILLRCGFNPEEYIENDDFLQVLDFNTEKSVRVLGGAVSSTNQEVLRHIENTIRTCIIERRNENGYQTELHPERRISAAGFGVDRSAVPVADKVRDDSDEIFGGAETPGIQRTPDDRQTIRSLSGNRGTGNGSGGSDYEANRQGSRLVRRTEKQRPSGVGGTDEHIQGAGRGNRTGGDDLQLNLFQTDEQNIMQQEAEDTQTSSAFSFLLPSDPAVWEYNDIKERHPDDVVVYQMGDFFEIYGEQAHEVAEELGLRLGSRALPSGGRVDMCGFPADQLEQYLEQLRDNHDVTVSALQEDGSRHREYSVLSIDHEAEQDINNHEAECGADGVRAFRDKEATKTTTLRELHDSNKDNIARAVEQDVAYRKAVETNNLKEIGMEGRAAVRRAVQNSGNEELARAYSEIPEFFRRFNFEVLGQAYAQMSVERARAEVEASSEAEKEYDLGFGHLGNGVTVWNRLEEVDGDYRTVAHIAPDRTVTIYDEDMPQEIRDKIQHEADTLEMTISSTQNIPVFSVPPRNMTLEKAKEKINEFCEERYGEQADFSNLEQVGIAFTTITNDEIPIQVNVDLVHYRINRYFDGQFLESRQYDTLDSLILNELDCLDFDELTFISEEDMESIKSFRKDDYQLLSRLQADCEYFLAAGGRNEKHLWAKSVFGQIAKMRELYDSLPEKPEWLSEADIDRYAERMKPRYQVITFDHVENGFDEKKDCQTQAEAENLAQRYLQGTADGFAYAGAAVYDLEEKAYLQVYGDYPEKMDSAQELEQQKEKIYQPDDEPYIVCEWSESAVFEDGKRYSVREFDTLMKRADEEKVAGAKAAIEKYGTWEKWYEANDPENAIYLGYDKTKFTIVMPDGTTFTERQDIGDGDGGVLDFLAQYPNYKTIFPLLQQAAARPEQGDTFTIYQLKDGPETRDYRYESYESLKEMGLAIDRENYDLVYTAPLDGKTTLEDIYRTFNLDRPADFTGHSLSVSDVVVLTRNGKTEAHYCDSFGFTPVPEFVLQNENQVAQDQKQEKKNKLNETQVSVQINGEWETFPNVKAAEEASYEEYKANLRRTAENFRITDDHLGEGGPKAKFQANVEAIKLLKYLEETTGQAMPEQQKILSRYVGWGGLADVFDPDKESWSKEYTQLKELLTPEEYAAARGSTLNAHYTSPTVIKAIYEAVGHMGFETGTILEPSCGVGNFFGMLPEKMKNSRLYGVELDSISGRIARQLYPKADITVAGFETTDRRDFYDLAVGNVPFGQYQVNDKAYNKLNFSIHNYFFAKALDQVRVGGVVAFVTSRYTMDSKDSTVRRYLAQRAELLGAIRLPNNAFKANAGTEVVSDIIFLQKRDRLLETVPEWTQTGQTEDGFSINRYFLEHPEMVLGRQEPESTAHGMDYTVNPIEGLELADQLHNAVKYIGGSYREAERLEPGKDEAIDTSIPAAPDVKPYSYTVVEGTVYFRENSRMVRRNLNSIAEGRVKSMVELRDCVRELIDLQMDAATSDNEIKEKQVELNRLYDDFSAKYGLINDRANRLAFSADSSYYLLCALEVIDEDGKLERKADMFTKRTIKPHEAVASVDTASEALAVSISERACVDMAYMSELTGKTGDELAAELKGVIFRVPEEAEKDGNPHYVTADEYLSGNVRRKLRQAQRAAQQDPAFAINVEALTAAQPRDLDASEIEVRLGATWIDKGYVQQFMYETFDTPVYLRHHIKVNYSSFTAEWQITGKSYISQNNIAAYTTYGTSRANAYKILEDSLNLRDIRIYDTVEDVDGKKRRVLNGKETTLAAQKQQAIRSAFKDWIWKDPVRRQTLVHQYNEEMNSTRPREYDGRHINFVGMNPNIILREHQKNAIAHVLYGGNTLLAHEVGAGKTFEMVAAAMESKRLGLCQKSLFVVPNHLTTEQWAPEFLRLYPSANILVATESDFETGNRKKFCARIATGNYDAIIMGHSQFEKIPVSRERQERLLQAQIDEITEGIAEVQHSGGEHFTVKQLERTKKSLETRLEKLQAESRKDNVVTFEQLGVDRLFVDEAHNYKNLFLYTKMRNVAGLSTSDAQKSSDMFAKCRYMDEITGGRGVIFATGTPVSNSMTELYTMQRYLQYDRLKELNMLHFDCWASHFGETVTALELAPEGTGYRARTRFSKFFNLPELMNLFKEVADIKTADQLHLPTPEVEYHNIVAQPTEQQKEMVKVLSERASLVHSGTVDPSQDNMLKITSDGRKLGLDQRIINQMLPDEPGTKVNQCVANIMQIWRDGEADKLTQLVFCDISTPQAASSKKAKKALDKTPLHEPEPVFTIYEDIRQKLIAQGMPSNQIAFIHEANTEVKKKALFAKVRTGQVRVLMGSTAKMGAGTNVQDRLVALHDLDCPWRPGDLAQRKGRIERQGNKNSLVHVYRYVTEGTFDAYLWQTVENKQKFISQIMTSKSPVRSCDDVDETALSFAEIKALCAGDPRIKERMDLDVEVARLKLMKADHQSKQYRLEDQLLKYFPQEIETNKGLIRGLEADMETLAAHPHPEDGFAGIEIRGKTLMDKESAGAALLAACKETKGEEPVRIGSYRGFTLSVEFSAWKQDYTALLKGQITHQAVLGIDPRGNLIRIDNALAQMSQRLETVKNQLGNLYQQQAAAKEEVGKPFLFEKDLQVKSARMTELDIALNMDHKEKNIEEVESMEEKWKKEFAELSPKEKVELLKDKSNFADFLLFTANDSNLESDEIYAEDIDELVRKWYEQRDTIPAPNVLPEENEAILNGVLCEKYRLTDEGMEANLQRAFGKMMDGEDLPAEYRAVEQGAATVALAGAYGMDMPGTVRQTLDSLNNLSVDYEALKDMSAYALSSAAVLKDTINAAYETDLYFANQEIAPRPDDGFSIDMI